MAKYKLGLVNFLLGAIAGDGGMGTVLTAVGDTVEDSAVLTTEEASVTDFKIEESDSPVLSIKTEADKMTITWSTFNTDTDTLIRFFGGTKTVAAGPEPEYWEAPDQIPEIELSLRGEWKQGGRILVPRAKISAKLDLSFKRTTMSKIDITATILQPTKVGEKRLRIANI